MGIFYYISMYSFHRSVSTRSVPLRVRFFMVFSCLVMTYSLTTISPKSEGGSESSASNSNKDTNQGQA